MLYAPVLLETLSPGSQARFAKVRELLTALGVRHTEIPVRPDGFLDNMRALVAHHDAPVSTL